MPALGSRFQPALVSRLRTVLPHALGRRDEHRPCRTPPDADDCVLSFAGREVAVANEELRGGMAIVAT